VRSDGDRHECRWWTGEVHVRRVNVHDSVVEVHDEVHGPSPTLVFPLAPGAEVEVDGARATVHSGSTVATFQTTAESTWNVDEAEVAPSFGRLTRAPRLSAAIHGSSAVTRVTIVGGDSGS
jgi:hypothetical protein